MYIKQTGTAIISEVMHYRYHGAHALNEERFEAILNWVIVAAN